MSKIIRRYSELITLPTFLERYNYLRLDGHVGSETFGFDRYLNQKIYHSKEWRSIKDAVIARDFGRDLGVPGYEIHGRIYIHHMNPIIPEDVMNHSPDILELEYLICTTHQTHNAIHYGDSSLLSREPIVRKPNDTCPWKSTR